MKSLAHPTTWAPNKMIFPAHGLPRSLGLTRPILLPRRAPQPLVPHDTTSVRPVVIGYLRVWAADPPEVTSRLTTEMHVYAEAEGLALADVFTDLFDPQPGVSDRAAFCALMDALRRKQYFGVVIPAPLHLSRHPASYTARRTIIETEAGARLLTIGNRS